MAKEKEVLSRGALIDKVYEGCQGDFQSKAAAARAVNMTLDSIVGHLSAGGDVRLDKFGSFSVEHRGARTGHKPRTKEEIAIPAKNVVKFKAASVVKESVQGVEAE